MENLRPFIKFIEYGRLLTHEDGLKHVKTLPFLSIVHCIEGKYELALDKETLEAIKSGEVFIAPRDVYQTIIHRNDKKSKEMRAEWLFIDCQISDESCIEDVYSFPKILKKADAKQIINLIREFSLTNSPYKKNALVFSLLDFLISKAKVKDTESKLTIRIRNIIKDNLKTITPMKIANNLYISLPTLHRYFKKYLNSSPAKYINYMKLQKASLLLQETDLTIGEIANEVGFNDQLYFSKAFKKMFNVSPSVYKGKVNSMNENNG